MKLKLTYRGKTYELSVKYMALSLIGESTAKHCYEWPPDSYSWDACSSKYYRPFVRVAMPAQTDASERQIARDLTRKLLARTTRSERSAIKNTLPVLLEVAGKTEHDLAAGVDLPVRTIQRWAKGEKVPTPRHFVTMANWFRGIIGARFRDADMLDQEVTPDQIRARPA